MTEGSLAQERESEEQVLGALMLSPSLVPEVSDQLSVEELTSQTHRLVYGAILALYAEGAPVDVLSVSQRLRAEKVDPVRISDIGASAVTAQGVWYHVRRVRAAAKLRSLAGLGSILARKAMEPEADAAEVQEMAEDGVWKIATDRAAGRIPWAQALGDAHDRIEYHYQHGSEVTGIPTGIRAVDIALGGIQPRWLVYVGARPGVGKTALAMQSAVHAAREGHRVLVISLEMSAEEIANRTLCGVAGVSYTQVRHKQMTDQDWKRFANAEASLRDLPIDIYDTDVETVSQIATRVRRHRPALVIVDYVQLMRAGTWVGNRNEEISSISRGLKLLARETHIPILAPVQLNRLSTKEERKPNLTDLRESGSLEQDADVVYLLHRTEEMHNSVEFLRAKFRFGPTGYDKVGWDATRTMFYDIL